MLQPSARRVKAIDRSICRWLVDGKLSWGEPDDVTILAMGIVNDTEGSGFRLLELFDLPKDRDACPEWSRVVSYRM